MKSRLILELPVGSNVVAMCNYRDRVIVATAHGALYEIIYENDTDTYQCHSLFLVREDSCGQNH